MTSIVLLVVLLAAVGSVAVLIRPQRTSTFEFYLAGRRVGVVTNACAICGDYFSAASFLGVAAAVYASGLDGMWYATGFAAGFVPVVLFIAAPLRRFGEFSIPDFLGRRLESHGVRLASVAIVQLIILAYLVPQAVASGIIWELFIGRGLGGLSAYSTGVLVSTVAIMLMVSLGGMRGTTWTQAVQFLLLLAIFLWLAIIVVVSGFSYTDALRELSSRPLTNPVDTGGGWRLEEVANRLHPDSPASFGEPGGQYSQLGQFALILSLVLGTAGLPHIMNRYFTSPTGTAARMTTVWVVGLAGLFYALAVLLGTAARSVIRDVAADVPWVAELTTGGILRVPEYALLVLGRIFGGQAGLALIAVGALVAVLSTIAGLLLASAASWGHDIYERYINPRATQAQALWAGRAAVALVAAVSAVLALNVRPETLTGQFPSIVATMVTWAFVLAGSALTPVFILAIWWRRTTGPGAVAGMLTGAAAAVSMGAAGVLLGDSAYSEVLLTPTVFSAPCAAAVTVAVSLVTRPPEDTDRIWVRMHGTAADRRAVRIARLTVTGFGRRGGGRG
ncbi:solute symporter family protein [Streptomonospora wellingtoniae]|uniref:Cation acetate symporter n=1 Tax=Streptomonospora wellingtoniae TaxID=3075544 RepID=A0ABU2KUR2_9ACTN|nr:cation acetate symporter [Streptomonospora sp. DSM 45055]MDT0303036.1 cation acetate symporter [Streptomonospora sp. DSM 45055]